MGEFVRDNALAISGLLNREFGGPGLNPINLMDCGLKYPLVGIERLFVIRGKVISRSMYTYWKRSAPHPGLMAFDTPTRETCTLQRNAQILRCRHWLH